MEFQNNDPKIGWAEASTVMSRFQEVKKAHRTEALSWGCMSEKQANDYGQVAAWLDMEARHRRLRVLRCTSDDGRVARHKVFLLEEEDGEVSSVEFGGWVSMSELKRGAYGGTDWLYKVEPINDEWVRVEIMITDMFPDHEMFKRSDGSRINLGFNDYDPFYSFTVEIHQDDLVDTF